MIGTGMDLPKVYAASFVVRIKLEETAEESGRAVWRGQITHVQKRTCALERLRGQENQWFCSGGAGGMEPQDDQSLGPRGHYETVGIGGAVASYKVPRRVLFFDEEALALTGTAKIKTADVKALALKRLEAEMQ